MDLRDLALLSAAVDAGSITGGADACGLSLPAASTRLAALERRFGVSLLHRGRRGVTPTTAGAAFLEHAHSMLDEAHALDRLMAAHRLGLHDEVRLATNSSAVDMLTEFLAALLAQVPSVTVTLDEVSSPVALRRVRDGDATLAVVSTEVGPGLEARDLWDDHLVVVGLADAGPHPTLAQVLGRPLIGLTADSPLQAMLDRRAHAQGLTPAYRVRLPSLPAVAAVAATGAGPAIVPLGTARRLGVPDALVGRLDESWARRTARLVCRRFDDLPEPLARFVDAFLRYADEVAAG